VEIKEPKKFAGSDYMAAGKIGGLDMGSQQQIITTKSKSRDKYDLDSKYDLNSDPLLGDDQDKHDADAWLNARPEPNRLTNGSSVNMPREWDAKSSDDLLRRRNDSGLEAGQNTSRFGTQTGYDRANVWDGDHDARDGDRFGRESSNDKDVSFWAKTLNHDSSGTDRFNAARFMPFKDESGNLGLGAHEPRMAEPGSAADSTRTTGLPAALPPGFGNFTPLDDGQRRQIGGQTGEQAGMSQALRAWEPPPSGRLPSKSGSNPGQTSPARVVAPNRPINLPFPKRPDSPF
jgi:hypothetical protein